MVEFFEHSSNFIRAMRFNNCSRPWWVYVETFAPAFVKLVIVLSILDFDDQTRAAGYAAVRDGPGTGRRRGRHGRRQRVPNTGGKIRRYSARGLRHLLLATEFLEKIGFWFLLYGATQQFFYDWHTLLRQSIFCNGPLGVLMRNRTGGSVSILPGCAAIGMGNLIQADGIDPGNGFGTVMPFGVFDVVYALTITGPLGGINGVSLRLNAAGSIEGTNVRSEEIDINAGEEVDLVLPVTLHYPLVGGGTITWELCGPAVPVGLQSKQGDIVIGKLD